MILVLQGRSAGFHQVQLGSSGFRWVPQGEDRSGQVWLGANLQLVAGRHTLAAQSPKAFGLFFMVLLARQLAKSKVPKFFFSELCFLAIKFRNFLTLQKFDVRFQMFEFGFILRAKCSGSSKFDLPMFGEFEVRFFDVRSTSITNYVPICCYVLIILQNKFI